MSRQWRNLPRSYATSYSRMLNAIAGQSKFFLRRRSLTCYWPQIGDRFRTGSDLLFVGQAPNGWGQKGDGVWLSHGSVPAIRDIRAFSEELAIGGSHPMEWVETEGLLSRPFWQVIRRMAWSHRPKVRSGWTRYIAWSNLYKVAPAKGRNPDEELCEAQWVYCKSLLAKEIEHWQPAGVVFLTGHQWLYDFADGLFPVRAGSLDILVGSFQGVPAVASPHPGYASRKGLATPLLARKLSRALAEAL